MRIHSGEGPNEPPKGWHRLETQFGPLGVRPLNMDVLKLWGDGIIINRVHYRLYGPLYRDGQRCLQRSSRSRSPARRAGAFQAFAGVGCA